MRFSDYLQTMPDADQTALPVELTLGYGRLQLAERLHRDTPTAAAMLGTLAAAHAALRSALAILDRRVPDPALDAAPPPAVPTDELPPAWDALVGDGRREAVGALIEMAAEMARNAVRAIRGDADLAAVHKLVRDALLMLADVRDETLGAG